MAAGAEGMTATTPVPESWDAQFDALRQRFPNVRGNMLVALHIVMQQPDVTNNDAKARAAMFGATVSITNLEAARRLLNPPAPTVTVSAEAAVAAPATAAERSPSPSRQAEPTVDAEQLIRTIVGRLQDEGAVEARRLKDAVRQAIAILSRAVGSEPGLGSEP